MFKKILLLARLLVISMSFLINEVPHSSEDSSVAKMISKLIEKTGRSTVHFSNSNREILRHLLRSHELEMTVVVNDFQSTSISESRKIEVTILHLGSRLELHRFFNAILQEGVFLHNGYFVIFCDKTDEREMGEIFSKFWKIFIYNVNVLTPNDNSSDLVSMFTYMPFGNGSCNNTDSVLINQFSKSSSHWTTNVFFPKKFKQMNRCPMSFGSYISVPYFMVKYVDGVKKFHGFFVDIANNFGQILNFTANFTHQEDATQIVQNLTATGLTKRVIDNEVNCIFTTASWYKDQIMSATRTIFFDSAILVVPKPFLFGSIEKLLLPFNAASWVSIAVAVLLACCLIMLSHFTPKAFQDQVIGSKVRGSMLNVWNVFLGGGVSRLPQSNFPRFLMMKFIVFSLIIRSLYQGRVFDILKRDERTVKLKTIDDYIEHQYTFYIYPNLVASLEGSKLLNNSRYETIADSDILPYCFKTLDSSFKGVVLRYARPVMYLNLINRGNFTFRLANEAVKSNPLVFYFTKNFYLLDEFSSLVARYDSAELLESMMRKYNDPDEMNRIERQPAATALDYSDTRGIFEILYYGSALSLLSFICEIGFGYFGKILHGKKI